MMPITQMQIHQAAEQVKINNDPLLITQTLTCVTHDSDTFLRFRLAPFRMQSNALPT